MLCIVCQTRFSLGSYVVGRLESDLCAELCRYFCLVASPPRRCRSDLFFSKSLCISAANAGFICGSFSLTSLCTVDLLIPKRAAASRTVLCFSMRYCASSSQRSFSEYMGWDRFIMPSQLTLNTDISALQYFCFSI